ncbi:hypothetical protein MOUN0_D04236 [Monosporozyma unispora]
MDTATLPIILIIYTKIFSFYSCQFNNWYKLTCKQLKKDTLFSKLKRVPDVVLVYIA